MKNKKADFTMAQIIGLIILLILVAWVIIWYTSLGKTGDGILGGLFG